MVEIPEDLKAITEYSPTLSFFLNGKKVVLDASTVDPQSTLLDFIRTQRSLTGTKLGCMCISFCIKCLLIMLCRRRRSVAQTWLTRGS